MNTHDIELLSTIHDAVQRACNYEVTVLKASEEIRVAIESDRKRRGEPVAWLRNERGDYQGKAVFDPLVLLAEPLPGAYTATYSPYTPPHNPPSRCVPAKPMR